jgi:hypothetical protein
VLDDTRVPCFFTVVTKSNNISVFPTVPTIKTYVMYWIIASAS